MSLVPRIAQRRPFDAGAGARPRPGANRGWGGIGGFMRGETGPTFAGWHPMPRDASDETSAAYMLAAGRANDLIHNSGWLTGAIEQAVANTVGTGLRLRLTPDAKAIGWSEQQATDWAAETEGRYCRWSNDPYECDIEGRRTVGEMQASSFKAWFGPGEIVSESALKSRPGGTYRTKVRLIPAHRLSQRSMAPRMSQGVEMDTEWMPIAYWFWRKLGDMGADREIRIEARNAAGRPRIVHVYDGVPGQYRGISPLVAALETTRKFDQLGQATLTANLIRAVYAWTVTSEEPTEDVIKGFLTPVEQARMESEGVSAYEAYAAMQEGWYRDNPTINLGQHGRLAHMFPGQELKFLGSGTASDYQAMVPVLLREIMRCLGLTFESGTGDYSGATYASMNNATTEIFEITKYRRKHIVGKAWSPHAMAWLEEDIAYGRTPFPGGLAGFYRLRAAATAHEWVGSPRPSADLLKQAKAHETYRNMGVISDEMICSDLGTDVLDVYKQRAREQQLRDALKLPLMLAPPAQPGKDEEEEGEEKPAGKAKPADEKKSLPAPKKD